MASLALKSLIGATASITALGFGGFNTVAEAAVLNYAFEVRIDQGIYRGLHRGAFQFDNSKMTACLTDPTFQCATPGNGDLALSFNFLNNTYTQVDDVDYTGISSQFPAIYYDPDLERRGLNPYLLSLIVLPPRANPSFSIIGNRFFLGFNSIGEAANSANEVGTVSYIRLPDRPPAPLPPPPDPCASSSDQCQVEAVPEPAEIAGSVVAVGLLSLFWRSRRRKSAPKF